MRGRAARAAEDEGALVAGAPPPARRQGVLLLAAVALAWGLTWPVNKALLEHVPPIWSVALRTAIATAALFALAAARGRLAPPPRADLPVLLSITLFHMVGFTTLSIWGLDRVPTGRSVVLAYTTPLWVTPGARLFLKEPLTPRRMAGVGVGLLGLAALFNPLAFDWADREVVLGHGAILAAALLWAASILHIRAHRWRSTPLELLPWETLLATVILVPLARAVTACPAVAWSIPVALLLLYGAIPGTALAYWAVATAGRALPAVTISLGLLATPVISVLAATLWLGEAVTPSLLVAMVLVLGGVAIGAGAERR